MKYAIQVLKAQKAHLLDVLNQFKSTENIDKKRKSQEYIKDIDKALNVLENKNIQNTIFDQ
jgi:adenylate kinase family enzyme